MRFESWEDVHSGSRFALGVLARLDAVATGALRPEGINSSDARLDSS